MLHQFFGGVHPAEHKELTRNKATTPLKEAPAQVVIPMSMHVGAPCKPVVAVGDEVKVGQLIGETTGLGAPIHASVSGKVVAVDFRPVSGGGNAMSVVIENDFKDTPDPAIQHRDNVDALTGAEIIEIVKDAGIVGLGGAGFPTHVKLSGAVGKVDTLILNGVGCEPYITNDRRLMLERGEAVIGGARLLAKAVGLKEAVIAVKSNKTDTIEHLKSLVGPAGDVKIEGVHALYPQGAEKQLIQTITGRQVPPGKLPADVQCLVCNVASAAAVWDAVTEGKPLTKRIVTVTGGAVAEPGNYLVPVGTPISHLLQMAGGFKSEPERVINGGPMMGIAMYDLDTPVAKTCGCILCMTKEEAPAQDPAQTCIRCGKCVEVCPMNLTPLFMRMRVNKSKWAEAEALNVMDCIECGSCNYICPARLPLVQSFRTAKFAIKEEAAKAKATREKEAAKA